MWRGGTELQAVQARVSPNLHVSINPEAVHTLFGGFYGGVITQAQLIKSLAVGDCFNQKPFWLSQKGDGGPWCGGGTGSSDPLTVCFVTLASNAPTWKGGTLGTVTSFTYQETP